MIITNKLKIVAGSLLTVALVAVLGLAVWRTQSQKATVSRPKATGGAGFCVDPNLTFHLACGSNNSCVRKRGAGSNLNGCTRVGQNCGVGGGVCLPPSQTHLACGSNSTCIRKVGAGSNLNGCLAVGQTCTTCSGTTPDLCGTTCTNKQTDNNNCGACGNACGSTQTCTGGVCVTPSGCTTDPQCPDTQKCSSGTCVDVVCTTTPPVCKKNVVSNHQCQVVNDDGASCTATDSQSGLCSGGVCVPGQTEVNFCWGNGGTNGRCMDCNGDGVINILDFSCFARNWRQNVQ